MRIQGKKSIDKKKIRRKGKDVLALTLTSDIKIKKGKESVLTLNKGNKDMIDKGRIN